MCQPVGVYIRCGGTRLRSEAAMSKHSTAVSKQNNAMSKHKAPASDGQSKPSRSHSKHTSSRSAWKVCGAIVPIVAVILGMSGAFDLSMLSWAPSVATKASAAPKVSSARKDEPHKLSVATSPGPDVRDIASDVALEDGVHVGACVAEGCAPGALCSDVEQNCREWARGGECEANPVFMHSKCNASCGLCGGPSYRAPKPPRSEKALGGECRDESPHCSAWASAGECENNPGFMASSCSELHGDSTL